MSFNFRDFTPLALFDLIAGREIPERVAASRRRKGIVLRWRRDGNDKLVGEWHTED